MRFYVFGIDDRMYGPEDISVIQGWAQEGRVGSDTRLRNADTGDETTFGQLMGAFKGPPVVPQVVQPAVDMAAAASRAATGYFTWSLIDSAAGIIGFYFLHFMGVIFAGYGAYNGYMAYKAGHRFGLAAFIFGIVAVIAVLVGWVLRLNKAI